MKKKLKKGFTLVELVIVIAVIAILSAVLIPTFGNVIQNANDSAAFSTASNALTKYTTNQAQAGESTILPDGYILVFDKEQSFGTTAIGASGDPGNPKYVFEFKNGSLKQYQDESNKKFYTYDTDATTGVKSKVIDLAKIYKSTTNGYTVSESTVTEADNKTHHNPIFVNGSNITYFGAYVLDGTLSGSVVKGRVLLLATTA